MKIILAFWCGLSGLTVPRLAHPFKDSSPSISYQLKDNQIIKTMDQPIEIHHQAENLLHRTSYFKQNQVVLPQEDLEYIRSNQIPLNLTFKFQFEWWNGRHHHTLLPPLPLVFQPLGASEVARQPKVIVSRLAWPSSYIRDDRVFAHSITFAYDQEFNLNLLHQLESDLSEREIQSIAQGPSGAPTHYRFQLKELTLNYPVPSLLRELDSRFLEVPQVYSHDQWTKWWTDAFNPTFFNSPFFREDNWDSYFFRPRPNDSLRRKWENPRIGSQQLLDLFLDYQPYSHLKIYQYFFSRPRLKIRYHQVLDLKGQFDGQVLVLNPTQDYWTAFKFHYSDWSWWLNFVQWVNKDDELLLTSKNDKLVQGEARIKVVIQKDNLSDLPLITQGGILQLGAHEKLEPAIFEWFKTQNSSFFASEVIAHYSISQLPSATSFLLQARAEAQFQGMIELNFQGLIRTTKTQPPTVTPPKKELSKWAIVSWSLMGLIVLCLFSLVLLKFTKSKAPPQ